MRHRLTPGGPDLVGDWIGDQAINVVDRDLNGAVADPVLYRDDEYRLEVEFNGRPWSFDGDVALLRLVTEAKAEAQQCRLRWHQGPLLVALNGSASKNEIICLGRIAEKVIRS